MPEKTKKKMGRPVFDGKDEKTVLAKLEDAWLCGFSDEQACFVAEISPDALYRYEKLHPDFRERKKKLKQSLEMKVKKDFAGKIYSDGEMPFKQWWAERKLKNEFSARTEVSDVTPGKVTITINPPKLDEPESDKNRLPADAEAVGSVADTTGQDD